MSTVNVDVGVDVEGDQTGKDADDEEEEEGEEVIAEVDEDDFVEDEEPTFMPTRDVLAELDSLDDVLGVSTGEDEVINLKPKQVMVLFERGAPQKKCVPSLSSLIPLGSAFLEGRPQWFNTRSAPLIGAALSGNARSS